jgi:hypothetical protein
MGNSTKTLQSFIDSVQTIGDLTPVLANAGGYTLEPAITIANDVMTELIAERFNWKWNRVKLAPFYINSFQQDYASVGVNNIGWLESCTRVDIGNTQIPKPTNPVETVRDLQITSSQSGWPSQIAWLPNNLLEQGQWPGAGMLYTTPVGAIAMPNNGPTNIADSNGNILVLTGYGITGLQAPMAPPASAPGTLVPDGTCQWTVADPNAQGLRVNPCPPQNGNLWLIRPFAQAQPPQFTNSLAQKIDPIPDSYSKWFRDGFIAYCHRHSADPKVKARFPQAYELWMSSVLAAAKAGDREQEAMGFIPVRSIMDGGSGLNIGPAWPYGPGVIR